MNLWMFKQKINDIDGTENITERFKLFRVWIENTYVGYQKNWELEKQETIMNVASEKDFLKSRMYLEMQEDWKGISYDMLIHLYNCMGWELDAALKDRTLNYCDENACLYYEINYDEVYKRIEKIEDPVEFAYAVLESVVNVPETCRLYKEFGMKVISGLSEYQLEECLAWLDSKKQKVFVAMCFADELNKARRKIEMAVKNCGYEPVFIDEKEHNHQIVPEIYKEIEDAVFVIADLSKQRGGVYYEAGYAAAKGKPVILSCRKNEQKDVHFDVAQINTIFWEDEIDLQKRLEKRICATVGRGKEIL